jgi:beta-barrel assembly-enhancing protease
METAVSNRGRNMDMKHRRLGIVAVVLIGCVAACVHNPVTGEREFGFVSTAQEINIGEQQYPPAQQMQGGLYRVDPDLTGYVQQVGQRVAANSGVELPYEFVVLNNGVPNAWALPGGKLAINRGLLMELTSEAELAAVLGHEIAHAAARHGAKALERGVVSQVVLLGVLVGARNSEYAGTALGAAQLAAGLLNLRYGRDAEREADYYGTRFMARAGYDPEAAVTLQRTFLRLSDDREPSWLEGLFASHPPSSERVRNNRSLLATLRAEGYMGELGRDAYARAISQLVADAEAYAAHAEAMRALVDGRDTDAERLLAAAIAAQPAEPAFHGLLGDLRLRQQRYGDAIVNYDRALDLDGEYFAYFLGRGVARARLGEGAAAGSDLTRSMRYLPTATAYHELGVLAEADRDVDTAIRYYRTAAQSDSPIGRSAARRATRLDLPRNPGRYLTAAVSVDRNGRLVLQVANPTGEALHSVEVVIQTIDSLGARESHRRRISNVAPGATALVLIRDSAAGIVEARAEVVAASPAATSLGASGSTP